MSDETKLALEVLRRVRNASQKDGYAQYAFANLLRDSEIAVGLEPPRDLNDAETRNWKKERGFL